MFKRLTTLALCLTLVAIPQVSFAQGEGEQLEEDNSGKELLRSATYGVLAGTLVGAATLAFTDKPGENLNRVARGASLGLYAGILLGIYVVKVVPKQIEENTPDYIEGLPPEEASNFKVFPIISEKGVEGIATQATLFSF